MSINPTEIGHAQLDLRDVDPRVGKPVGGAQLLEPCSALSIRQWAMAMDYPNPIHWDDVHARQSKFGGLIAPQSFTVALDCGQGVQAGLVGHIPNSMIMFGGDEWWYYGPRIRPGDHHISERRFLDYKVTETRFAGPTMFSRGETVHRNRDGVMVAKQRATVIRYLQAEAEKRNIFGEAGSAAPVWTEKSLDEIDRIRTDWIMSNRQGISPRFSDVKLGDVLPRRVVGPHSLISFTTEARAIPFNIWGSAQWMKPSGIDNPWINNDPGWPQGFGMDHEGAKIDPRLLDGLYQGPSKHHMTPMDGAGVRLTRAFGFGVSMNAWIADYVAYWSGNDGLLRHTKTNFRGLALEGDVSFLDAEVIGKHADSAWGVPIVEIKVKMTNQDGVLLVDGHVDVEIPL